MMLHIGKTGTVKQKPLISAFPRWWLVRLRQDYREDDYREDGYILKALKEAEKLFQVVNTAKCVQGRIFTFAGHDLNLM